LVFSASLILVFVIFVAGCIGPDYVPYHQIVLVKLTPDGIVEWSKVIDTGRDQKAHNIIQTSDGGFAIYAEIADVQSYGVYLDHLLRLSDSGKLLWDRNLYELGCGPDILIPTTRGGIVTAWRGTICRFDAGGNNVCTYATGIDLKVDENGNLVNATSLDCPANSKNKCMDLVENNCFPVRINNASAKPLNTTQAGTVTDAHVLNNASRVAIQTGDGGYFSAGFGKGGRYEVIYFAKARTGVLMAVKLNPDGTIAWEKHVPNVAVNQVDRVIQTSDGGYVIMSEHDKFYDTWLDELFSGEWLTPHFS
jgi:hypothetical protein